MTLRPTHLDRIMTELKLENHQLAAKVPTSRQAIYKLRKGITRMLPDWAKRLGPHLGVSWQVLVDGPISPADQDRAELLAAFDVMSEEQRKAVMVVVRGMLPQNSAELPPGRINRLMGGVTLDDLDMATLEKELIAGLLAVRRRQVQLNTGVPTTSPPPKEPPPPDPPMGGNVAENEDIGDCAKAVPPRVPA